MTGKKIPNGNHFFFLLTLEGNLVAADVNVGVTRKKNHALAKLQMKFQPMSNKDLAAPSPPPSRELWAEGAEDV